MIIHLSQNPSSLHTTGKQKYDSKKERRNGNNEIRTKKEDIESKENLWKLKEL